VILDRLDRCDLYRKLSPGFALGFDFLRRPDSASLADGRYSIQGEEVVAIVQAYTTRTLEQGRWEAHRRHADIQYIVTGSERMGIVPLTKSLALLPPYDAEKDVEFYTADQGMGQLVRVDAGSFAVFLPHDVHMPNLELDGPGTVKKIVIKVLLD